MNRGKSLPEVWTTRKFVNPNIHEKQKQRKKVDYRRRVKFIAHAQIIFECVNLLLLILSIGTAMVFTMVVVDGSNDVNGNIEGQKAPENVLFSYTWTFVAAFAANSGLQLWSSLCLLKGTKIGITTLQALECVIFWQHVHITYTLLDFMSLIVYSKLIKVADIVIFITYCFLFIRLYFLLEVQDFKLALKRKLYGERMFDKIKKGHPVVVAF